jgi:hypothetical protein
MSDRLCRFLEVDIKTEGHGIIRVLHLLESVLKFGNFYSFVILSDPFDKLRANSGSEESHFQ